MNFEYVGIISRIGLRTTTTFERTTGLLPVSALSSIAAVQTTFEHASGTIGTRRGFMKHFSSAYDYLQARLVAKKPTALHTLLRKLRRLGPVWSVPGCDTPDAALEDICLDREAIAKLDNHLVETTYLRSMPFTSLLLASVAQTDLTVHKKCLHLLERTTCRHAPTVVSLVAQEIQVGADPTPIPTSAPHQLPTHTFQPAVPLTRRRGAIELKLANFSSLDVIISKNDYILLAHNIIEDPDFPIAPFWHAEYATQRSWLDSALQLPEDSANGFFGQEVLLKKVLQQLNSTGAFPHPGKLRLLRSSAATETQKLIQAEVAAALNSESNRTLRCKIEHLIPQIASTEEQSKALRLIPLRKFHVADVMQLSNSSIVMLMTAQMQLIIDEDGITDINQDCICDIISDYSGDVDEHYWNDKSVLDINCNHRKRELIQGWILALEVSNIVHLELYSDGGNYCGPLKSVELTDDPIVGVDLPMSSIHDMHRFPVLEFQRGKDGNIILPLDDGYLSARSSGFYTNLSGLTGVPSASSGSPFSGGSSSVNDEHNQDRADSGGSADLSKSSNTASVYSTASKTSKEEKRDAASKERTSKETSLTELLRTVPSRSRNIPQPQEIYTYDKKRIAMNSVRAYHSRRLNSLRMGWDVPHRSQGLQQPGFRPHKMMYKNNCGRRPSPDWDLPSVGKPHFAHENSARGPLALFNEQEDAVETAMNGTPFYFPADKDVFVPPRRPHQDEISTMLWKYPQNFAQPYQMKALQKERDDCETGTMGVDGGILICGQEVQAWSARPMDDPFT